MAKTNEISTEKRAQIAILNKTGHSQRDIARLVGVSKTGVATTLSRFAETNSFEDRKRCGRPKKTTESDDRHILMICKRDRFKTAPAIAAEVNESVLQPISVTTIKRRLIANGFNGRVAKKKPLLRTVNKRKRLAFARLHKDWTVEDWKKVFWTDESKFELFGNKRRKYVRRRVGESHKENCITPTVKHGGGSVMVWGGFSYDGVGDLIKIDGIMDKNYYHRILSRHAVPSGTRLIGQNFVFQQDNDPKHTSKLCKAYLESKEVQGVLKIMDWPPQSPDVNPIELLWDEMDRQVRETTITSEKSMFENLKRVWDSLRATTLHKLVERMPKICSAIIKAKGGYFNEKTLN